MKIFIATDIFGRGKYLDALCIELENVCSSIFIVSPYSRSQMTLANEDEAYSKFLSECGHEKFSKVVTKEISRGSEETFLIGFSAGAAAIWHSIGSNVFNNLARFVGFYPTQIEDYLESSPSCPTEIIIPYCEERFDVVEISAILTKNSAVECQLTELFHGFMNPQSKNYNSARAKTFSKAINVDILRHASS